VSRTRRSKSWVARMLLIGASVTALVWAAAPVARSQPVMPMRRYGQARINGEGAPDGTLVEFTLLGTPVASDFTETVEGEPGWYGVPENVVIEGEPGEEVRFYVTGVEAIQSPKAYTSGTMRQDMDVYQAWLDTELSAPKLVPPHSSFNVVAATTNVGGATAEAVTAEIGLSEGAQLMAGESVSKTVSPVMNAGRTVSVTWALSCTHAGPVTVTVVPSGIDTMTREPIPEMGLFPGVAVVGQGYSLLVPVVVKDYHP